MSRKVTAVVLCEDKQSRAVLYRYLRHERGFERVRVTRTITPSRTVITSWRTS